MLFLANLSKITRNATYFVITQKVFAIEQNVVYGYNQLFSATAVKRSSGYVTGRELGLSDDRVTA